MYVLYSFLLLFGAVGMYSYELTDITGKVGMDKNRNNPAMSACYLTANQTKRIVHIQRFFTWNKKY